MRFFAYQRCMSFCCRFCWRPNSVPTINSRKRWEPLLFFNRLITSGDDRQFCGNVFWKKTHLTLTQWISVTLVTFWYNSDTYQMVNWCKISSINSISLKNFHRLPSFNILHLPPAPTISEKSQPPQKRSTTKLRAGHLCFQVLQLGCWDVVLHLLHHLKKLVEGWMMFFPERLGEGRFLGAVSLSSLTWLAWFKLLNLNLLDLTCLTWTCLTKTFLTWLSWLDLGKLLTWSA